MMAWLFIGIVLVGTIAGLRAPGSPLEVSDGPDG
jgi:hypothetical protein